MPRNYTKSEQKVYKKHNPDTMEKALREYNSSDKSLAEISKKYNIPKSVLHRHNSSSMKQQGGQTVLSPAEEDYIIKYINVCSEWGYPLEHIDLRFLIKGYLDKLGIQKTKFKNNMPGPDFVTSFVRRHNDKISTRLSQNIKRARAAVSPEMIEQYFTELEVSLRDIPPSNIVNYDETNLTDDPGRKRVLVKRSVKYPERVMNHTKGSTSIMIAAAADGIVLPPYVVYKAQNIYDTWRQNGPKGCRYNNTASGWFDGTTFEDWVRTIAMPYLTQKTGTKILIGDNLASHLSIDLIKDCQEQDIRFIFLPANSTHLTQPLDVAFFRPLKSAWREILFRWKNTDGRMQATIPKNVFPSLLKKLMEKVDCNATKNILAGFEKCGICPINKNKVLERIPSYASVENTNYKEAVDETVLSMLKEMRYGTNKNIQTANKKKKITVIAGKSVENLETGVEEFDGNKKDTATEEEDYARAGPSKLDQAVIRNKTYGLNNKITKVKTDLEKETKSKAELTKKGKFVRKCQTTENYDYARAGPSRENFESEITKTKNNYIEETENTDRSNNEITKVEAKTNNKMEKNTKAATPKEIKTVRKTLNKALIKKTKGNAIEEPVNKKMRQVLNPDHDDNATFTPLFHSSSNNMKRVDDVFDIDQIPIVFEDDNFNVVEEVEVNSTDHQEHFKKKRIEIVSEEVSGNVYTKPCISQLRKINILDKIDLKKNNNKIYRNDTELINDLINIDEEEEVNEEEQG